MDNRSAHTNTPRLRKFTETPLLIEGTFGSPFEGGRKAQNVLCAFQGDVWMHNSTCKRFLVPPEMTNNQMKSQ